MSGETGCGKPVICIGWSTIMRILRGQDVELENALLIPDSFISNGARRSGRGGDPSWDVDRVPCVDSLSQCAAKREGGE